MHKILIIEDDRTIAETIGKHLASWGYTVNIAADFKDIMAAFVDFDPQLVLLDIQLPYQNGFHWCTEIRKVSNVPVIFISSASDNMNIIMAVNMGGDDFISKPFDLNVLTVKVQAMLRRAYDFGGETNLLEHKGVILNSSEASLTYLEQKIELTKNENKILKLLMEKNATIVSRDAIMSYLWESDSYVDDNTLTVNITRLRKKLEDLGLTEYIITKKGIGYTIP